MASSRKVGEHHVATACLGGAGGRGMAWSVIAEENAGETSGARPWGPFDAAASYLASIL